MAGADVVALLSELIGYDTHNPAGNEGALAARLRDELAARGPDAVDVTAVGDKACVLARWGEPRVVVNAHLDTVPANTGWTGDPWKARVDGGRVVGLGAADTKGAIAAVLCALDEVRPKDLAVLFSGDEELGGTVIRSWLAGGHGGIAQAVVCEPTGCRAGTRHRGVVALQASYAGRGGHSSAADSMPAPVAELARVAVAWDDWGRRWRGQGPEGFEGMCVNIAKLDGGVAFNVVPDAASLQMSFRPGPGTDVRALVDELYGLARGTCPEARVETRLLNPPFATRELGAFRGWLGDVVDRPIDLAFWTEGAVLSEAGIDAVVFGPGDIAQAHAPDEWVAIDQLHRARDTFAAMFRASHGSR